MTITSLVHIHVPRTAGSSLHAFLHGPLKAAGIELISEHCFWGDYEPAPDRLFFIVLREPVARVLSLAAYILEQPSHQKHERLAALGIDKYLRDQNVKESLFTNGQVRLLAGRKSMGEPIGLAEYLAAATVLRRSDVVVALADDLDNGLCDLSSRLGVTIEGNSPRRNSTQPKQWSEESRYLAAFTNRWDSDLYRYAKRYLMRSREARQSTPPA